MDHWHRIQAALRQEAVDRMPFSLWRHFHREDRTALGLAATTLDLARSYDLDLVKLTPSGLYAIEDWAQGQIVYPGTDHDPPFLPAPAVARPAAWRHLPPLAPHTGALARELEAIGLVADALAGSRPVLMTVYSPLTLACKLVGQGMVNHWQQHPADLHAGLEIIAQTTARFARAALERGADGLFFATQLASQCSMAWADYQEFGVRYDLTVLDEVASHSSLTVLHLHGQEPFFELANLYPIDAVSWHDRESGPSLTQARGLTDRAFLTGLDRDLLGRGPAAAIAAQAREAMDQTKGRGLILGPSCVIPTTASPEHLQAVRDAALASG